MSGLLKRYAADRPITSPFKLWAAWFAGATAYHHPGKVSPPLHPDVWRAFDDGQRAAQQGYVRVPDFEEAWALVRHVQSGKPPRTFGRP